MLSIRIKNLRLRTFIGFNEEELKKRQDVIINLRFDYAAEKAADMDEVDYAVNYRTVTKRIIALVEGGRFLLLEKLASDILELVMEIEPVRHAEVEVDKPHALRFADSVSVSMSAGG